uniref:Uncharacterized protein n=1 Tax=Nelumbo nucifera TaxID=4432 RepID=A0A822YMQ7_NELNU|nr:TPA_asm: hypothetical protein HUJ06_011712 [Nelumbo nucifera]
MSGEGKSEDGDGDDEEPVRRGDAKKKHRGSGTGRNIRDAKQLVTLPFRKAKKLCRKKNYSSARNPGRNYRLVKNSYPWECS